MATRHVPVAGGAFDRRYVDGAKLAKARRRPQRDADAEDRAAESLLTTRWLEHDETLLPDLLRRFSAGFVERLRLKYHGLLSREDGEEIVLDALAHAWKSWAEFDGAKGTLGAWLWGIARNQAATVARAAWFRQRGHEIGAAPDELESLAVAPLGAPANDVGTTVGGEIMCVVAQAMSVLCEHAQAVIWADACARDEVVPSRELGRDLGIRPSTVRWHRARGIVHLRAEVERLLALKANGVADRGGGSAVCAFAPRSDLGRRSLHR
ncbi:MAG TPA: sigma-70 family RNA polymerase sigma factor [Pirellulales bacterium]|nr:sigma-70 family RNA polymerase sigma factor [Pirellulales bacterium]